MNTPTNRSNHRGVPRTKIERTISLRLIHTYSVEDPAGLRRPDLGASGVERREEHHLEVWWRSDLEERKERQPWGKTILTNSHQGGCLSSSIYRGEGRGGH